MGRGLLIGRVRGIPIRVHGSLFIALPLLAFIFGETFRRAAVLAGIPPQNLSGNPYLWGLGIAVALFLAVLVHELAHSLYALRRGGAVSGITLMIVGGVSQLSRPPQGARAEAIMAIAGPLTSLGIGAGFYGAYVASEGISWANLRFSLFYLAYLNILIGAFNLVPAFPMDGGRVLRAALVRPLGRLRATRVAAGVGKLLAVVFAALAILSFNLFLLVIAAFVFLAADAEAGQERLASALEGVRVADLMAPAPAGISPGLPASEAVGELARERQLALPVLDGEELKGLITAEDLARSALARRADLPVEGLTRPAPRVTPSDGARTAFEIMGEQGLPAVIVTEEGRVVGTLSRDDIVRAVRLRELRAREESRGVFWRRREA